jgi:hypothetical protein
MLHYVVYHYPRALAFSIAHWLPTAPTLPDFDLRLVELDINQRTSDCDVDIYFFFSLTFSIKLSF